MSKKLTEKQKVQRKWVRALRSGKYQQGRSKLHNLENQFCCLGVLCDLAVKAGVISTPLVDSSVGSYSYEDAAYYLPVAVRTWSGVRDSSGPFREENAV